MEAHPELRVTVDEILLVRKPPGWTSFDVVRRVRRMRGVRKVGHAGTLDPLATGLLIVCTGKKTKDLSAFLGYDKEYVAEMTLGGRTESYDAATPVVETRNTDGITEDRVREVLRSLIGPRLQVPPMWSAASVGGRRLYRYAREGVEVARRPREILIHDVVPLEIRVPLVRFRVTCSKGTYVRSLVHEMGEMLGCGAYLSALERTRIGPYRLDDAVTVDELAAPGAAGGTPPS